MHSHIKLLVPFIAFLLFGCTAPWKQSQRTSSSSSTPSRYSTSKKIETTEDLKDVFRIGGGLSKNIVKTLVFKRPPDRVVGSSWQYSIRLLDPDAERYTTGVVLFFFDGKCSDSDLTFKY